jgi:chromosome segregation ATPase
MKPVGDRKMNYHYPNGIEKRLKDAGLKAAIADELAKIHGEDYKALMDTMARKDELTNLRDEFREMRSDMRAFEGRIEKAIASIGESLRTEIGGLKSEIGGLKSEIGGLKSEVGDLRSQTGSLKSEMGSLKSELTAELKAQHAEAKLYAEQQMKGQTRLLTGVLGLVIFAATVVDKIPLGGN